MSGHNTFTAAPGKIVIYGEWTGSAYVEHQAYIRAVLSTPAGEDEPTINLTYSNGQGAASQANTIENIEIITGNVDYWRAQYDPRVTDSIPVTITRPLQGDIVWLSVYDATDDTNTQYLAFVRAIPGAPTDQEPNLQLSYYDEVDGDTNINQVIPATDSASGTASHWFDQQAEV